MTDPQRSRRFQRCERGSHRLLNHLLHEELVTKPSLELRRVNVDVHRVAREVEKQQEGWAVAGGDGGAIPRLGGAENKWIANGAAAHEHVALSPGGPRLRGTLHEPADFQRTCAVRDGEQRVRQLATPQGVGAVDESCRGWA